MAAWTDIEKQKLRSLHAQGFLPVEMVEHFPDRTRNAIIGQLNKMKLPTRAAYVGRGLNRPPRLKPDTELIIRLHCKWSWAPRSIAQALGKHPKAVYTILERYTERASA